MKDRIKALFAAGAVLLFASAGDAGAQTVAADVYDNAGVHVSFPGWVVVESVTRRSEQYRRLVTVQPDSNPNASRRCILSAREDEALRGSTQTELNESLREAAQNTPPDRSVQTLRSEFFIVDGVGVFEEEVFAPDRRFAVRSRTRHFAIAANGRTMSYLFYCAAVNEATLGRAEDMDAVVESLHFAEQTQP